ncbi:MAG: molybdopterin-dependent oxidoreductase [Dongiaceae bacterium]
MIRLAAALLLLCLLPAWAARAAEPLPPPSGPVILTVSGAIDRTNAPGRAEFDRAMLEALGVSQLTTSTDWTDGKPVFAGVLASKLLTAVGAHGSTAVATALNDYQITIPLDDLTRYPVLLALTMNGTQLTARDKGPVWVVYPRDDYAELRSPQINDRWIWQLRSLEIR